MTAYTPAPFLQGPALQDGSKLNSAFAWPAVSTDVDAIALGTTSANGYRLKAQRTQFTTVAAGTGAVIPSDLDVGQSVVIYNDGASALKVYATGPVTIDGTDGDTGATLTNGNRAEFFKISPTKILSARIGTVSA